MANTPTNLSLEETLWNAVKESDESQVKELLAQRAKANFEKYDQGVWGASHRESIIHIALQQKPVNNTIVQILLESGADPNARFQDYDWKGSGATKSAFVLALDISLSTRDSQLLQIFLANKADANLPSSRSVSTMRYDGSETWRPIHLAARSCFPEAILLLLQHGAEVDAIATKQGQSEWGDGSDTKENALHIICENYGSDDAQILLEHGANPNAIKQRLDLLQVLESGIGNPRGFYVSPYVQIPVKETPLHIALERNNTRLALLLLQHGADFSIPWIYGEYQIPSMNLMPGDILASVWNPQTHHLMPLEVQKTVKSILLCANRQQWKLPKEILCEIIKYSLLQSKNDWDRAQFMEGRKEEHKAQRLDQMKKRQEQLEEYYKNEKKKSLSHKLRSKCIIS